MHGLAVYTQCCIGERLQCVSGTVALQLDLSCNSKPHKDVSDSRVVIRYAEHPYMTCSFPIMHVSMHKWLIRKRLRCVFGAIACQLYLIYSSNTENRHLRQYSGRSICRTSIYDLQFFELCVSMHKMSYQKQVVMCVWIHNWPIISCIQLQPRKQIPLIVERLFDGQNVLIRLLFLSCVCKYTQDGISKRDRDACLRAITHQSQLACSSNQEKGISNSRRVIWCADRSYMLYSF